VHAVAGKRSCRADTGVYMKRVLCFANLQPPWISTRSPRPLTREKDRLGGDQQPDLMQRVLFDDGASKQRVDEA
jgi:hypothetical protein